MLSEVRRIFVEKRKGYDIEAQELYSDLKENLGIKGLEAVRVVNRYDVAGITEEEYARARRIVFSEPPVDLVYDEALPVDSEERAFAVEYLPGQFDQRADSAAQCLQILTQKERPQIRSARVIMLRGKISANEFARIKAYALTPWNPVKHRWTSRQAWRGRRRNRRRSRFWRALTVNRPENFRTFWKAGGWP